MRDIHFVPADHPRGQSAINTQSAAYSDAGLSVKVNWQPSSKPSQAKRAGKDKLA